MKTLTPVENAKQAFEQDPEVTAATARLNVAQENRLLVQQKIAAVAQEMKKPTTSESVEKPWSKAKQLLYGKPAPDVEAAVKAAARSLSELEGQESSWRAACSEGQRELESARMVAGSRVLEGLQPELRKHIATCLAAAEPYAIAAREYQTLVDEHTQGHIQSTPGNAVDYRSVLSDIKKLAERYDIRAILFDRWGAARVAQDLEDEGMEVIAFGQGFKDMSPPTKELLKLVLSKRLAHDGNPVLRWCVSNMVVRQDPASNLKPDKQKSTEKIDSVVAGIMALAGALTQQGQPVRRFTRTGGFSLYDAAELSPVRRCNA